MTRMPCARQMLQRRRHPRRRRFTAPLGRDKVDAFDLLRAGVPASETGRLLLLALKSGDGAARLLRSGYGCAHRAPLGSLSLGANPNMRGGTFQPPVAPMP